MTNTVDLPQWQTVQVPRAYVLRLAGLGFRPSEEDIAGDIDRLVKSIVVNSTDDSNVNLQFDEMYGELMLKVAIILNRRDYFFPDRKAFFGFLKLSLVRHKKTHIQRHAFTFKRTGIRHPKKGEEQEKFEETDAHCDFMAPEEPHKAVKIELDDEESGAANFFGTDDGHAEREANEEVEDFIRTNLNWAEAGVLHQEMEPNDAAMTHAFVDNNEGESRGKFKIRDSHKFMGLGFDKNGNLNYKKVLAQVRVKLEAYLKEKRMSETISEEQKIRAAELQLCQIFNMQVPAHVDPTIKRRAFTIAARTNLERVNKDVEALLETVGAYPPKKYGENVGCFGVLWEAGQRQCGICSIEESCRERAANIGLDKDDVRLSRKLLGASMTRTPLILPKIEPVPEDASQIDASSLVVYCSVDRDQEILDFLNESMVPVIYEGEIFYKLPAKGQKRIFCVGQPERIMKLRFCNPSDKLKSELVAFGHGPMWGVPDDMSLEDVTTLINEHIANQLK